MLLAVDTSTAQVGLAVYDGPQGQVIGEYAWRSLQGGRHTVELAPAISELLRRCGVSMEAIQALAVALGPGSFTSLRVGLSLVKGIAISRHLPIVGIPTLDVIAAGQQPARLPLLVVIQAGRSRLAVGMYKNSRKGWLSREPARVMTLDSLAQEIRTPMIVCGELTSAERQKLAGIDGVQLASPAQSLRRPAILAELAWKRWQAGEVADQAALSPIYLHVAGSVPP